MITLVYIGGLILLFFLLRGVNLWYWKINNILDEQIKQSTLLEEILQQIGDHLKNDNLHSETIHIDSVDNEELQKLKSDIKSRVASILPILFLFSKLPSCFKTIACFSIHFAASGMSAVITISFCFTLS